MLVYILLLLVFGVSGLLINGVSLKGNTAVKTCCQIRTDDNKTAKKMICILSALVLIIIASCRANSVGYDTINYEDYFKFKQIYPNNKSFEPIYEFINYIVVRLNLPFNFVLLICSSITIISFAVVIYKYSTNVSFSWFLFVAIGFFGNTFNAVRQYLAAAVFLISLRYILNGKFIPYLVCCVVAFYFHSSAIILFPMYFIRYFKLNKKTIGVSLCLTVLLGVFLEPIIKLVSLFTNTSYYERYFVTKILWEPIKLYYVLYSIGMVLVFIMFYVMRNKNKTASNEQNKIFDIFLILFYICVCIRTLGTFSHLFSLVNRFNIYFFFSIIFIIPYIVNDIKVEARDVVMGIILVLASVYNLVSALVRKTNGVYPYKFVWNNTYLDIVCLGIICVLCAMLLVQSFRLNEYYEVNKNVFKNINYKVNINNKRLSNH